MQLADLYTASINTNIAESQDELQLIKWHGCLAIVWVVDDNLISFKIIISCGELGELGFC